MNLHPLLKEYIVEMKQQGFKFYSRPNEHVNHVVWAIFERDNKIGSIEVDYWGEGFYINTIHKPNILSGTGFRVSGIKAIDKPTKEELETGFIICPSHSVEVIDSVIKYKDFDDYKKLRYNSMSSDFEEL